MLTVVDTIAEGDVEGVMDRPEGDSAEVQAERQKWYFTRSLTCRIVNLQF